LQCGEAGCTVPAVTSPIGDYLVESLLVLLVIVALAALVLTVARRAGFGQGRGLGSVELVARLPLEPRRSVYVVRVLDQVLIIGASEAGLSKLGELPESAVSALRGPEPSASFAAVLSSTLLRGAARSSKEAGETAPGASSSVPPGGTP
jgi:flagellar protein FliO/FliZ